MFRTRVLPSLTTLAALLLQGVSGNNPYQQLANGIQALSTEAIVGIAVGASLFIIGLIAFAIVWYYAEKLGITCLTGNGPKSRRTAPVTKQPVTVVSTTTTSQYQGPPPGYVGGAQPAYPPQPVYPAQPTGAYNQPPPQPVYPAQPTGAYTQPAPPPGYVPQPDDTVNARY